ncbi:VanZ like family protein [compost metagenome]
MLEDPGMMENSLAFANFTPFVSISQNLHRLSNTHDFINLFGNIALFVPLGIFIRLSATGSLFTAILYSLGLSAGLEVSQLLLSMGSFDVDDLILNVLGGLIGYAMYPRSIPLKLGRNGSEYNRDKDHYSANPWGMHKSHRIDNDPADKSANGNADVESCNI